MGLFRGRRTGRYAVAEDVKGMIRSAGLHSGDALPTYHELVARTGVSYVTVKRAMDVLDAEGLIRRIPSRGTFLARDLAPSPHDLKHIGVLYPSSRQSLFRHAYIVQIMQGVTEASPPQTDMHIFSMREDGLVQAGQLGEWLVDGVLLLNVENEEYLRAFAGWSIPGVVVDYRPVDSPLDVVACDNRAAARAMVAHLAALGHQRVVFVAVPNADAVPVKASRDPGETLLLRNPSDQRERHVESVHALRTRGMLAAEIFTPGYSRGWVANTADRIAALWTGPRPRPTAVMTNSTTHAVDLLRALEAHRLRAPRNFSFCTVATDVELVHDGRRVTTCRFNFTEMGRQAARVLAERCRMATAGKPRECLVGFDLVEGETTRAL